MKYLILFTLSLLSLFAQADQYSCLNDYVANKALPLLQQQKEIVLYCGGCVDNSFRKIEVDSVYLMNDDGCLRMFVEGKLIHEKNKTIKTSIDLAYTWINENGLTKNLCVALSLPVIMEDEKFYWKNFKPYEVPKANRKQKKEFLQLVDSILIELNTDKGISCTDYNGKRVQVDSLVSTFSDSANCISICYYFEGNQRKTIQLFPSQLHNLELLSAGKNYNDLYCEGYIFKQYHRGDEYYSGLSYPYTYLRIEKLRAQQLMEKLNRFILLSNSYNYQ